MRETYPQIFSIIHLSVTSTIDELVVAGDDIAYALTSSNGRAMIRTYLSVNGAPSRE